MKKLVLLAVLLASEPIWIHADIIYFKDGMKTNCQEKAWEENGEIKCEYEGVILSYRKADVLRIVKERTAEPATKKTASQKAIDKSRKKALTRLKTPSTSGGLVFYNPRRSHKYWSSATSKHDTFNEAISELAKQYDRSPQWVQTHMGETNNLNEIHQNLSNHKLKESSQDGQD